MTLWDVREAICEIGRRVWQKNMVAGNDGNFSYRLDENTVLCTPTGVSKGFLKVEDLVLCDLQGNQLPPQHGLNSRQLTSEIRLHLNIYQKRPDVRSVVHTHATYATAWALRRKPFPKGLLEEAELTLGDVPTTEYALTGSWEFARKLDPFLANHDTIFLANHGAVTMGVDPFAAYYRMEILDHVCHTFLMLGDQIDELPRLNNDQFKIIHEKKKQWGILDPREGLPYEEWASPKVNSLPLGEIPKFKGEPFNGEFPQVEDIPKYARLS